MSHAPKGSSIACRSVWFLQLFLQTFRYNIFVAYGGNDLPVTPHLRVIFRRQNCCVFLRVQSPHVRAFPMLLFLLKKSLFVHQKYRSKITEAAETSLHSVVLRITASFEIVQWRWCHMHQGSNDHS